jgi:hypothetical protein
MFWFLADYPYNTLSSDDDALITDFLDGWTDFHRRKISIFCHSCMYRNLGKFLEGYLLLFCPGIRTGALAFGFRKVIRPRVRSYGVSSIVTVSPGMSCIRFFCIFPDTYARMTMFEKASGSSTSNMAHGRALSTFPSTSILSSFGIRMLKTGG